MDRTFRKMSTWVALVALVVGGRAVEAQTPPPPMVAPLEVTTADAVVPMLTLPGITPASCTSCAPTAPMPVASSGIFLPRHTGGGSCATGCTDTLCGSSGCGEGGCV